MIYSKGISWIDDTRIPFVDEKVPRLNVSYEHKTNNNFGGGNDKRHGTSTQSVSEGQGRFTPNLLVSDDVLNDGNVSEAKANLNYKWNNTNSGSDIFISRGKYTPRSDKGSNSRYYDIDLWFNELIYGL